MLRWIERLRLMSAHKADVRVAAHGEAILGQVQWSLLRSFGKCMAGPPYGGQVRKLLQSLAAGETVAIHLMNRHQSGKYESSSLRLGPHGELVMVYSDREVPAVAVQERDKGSRG